MKKRRKTGGRKAGTPNRTTQQLRQWLIAFVDQNTKQIERDWKALDPRDRIQAFQQFLKYCLPTMQAVNLSASIEKELESLPDDKLEELANKIISHYETGKP